MSEPVRLEMRDHIAVLTLDRPETLNALDLATAFAQVKRLLTDSFDTPLEAQLERERAALVACAGHPDGEEGIRAFLEKRRPVFGQEAPRSAPR